VTSTGGGCVCVAGGGDAAVVHVVAPAALTLEVVWLHDSPSPRVGATTRAWPLVMHRQYAVAAVATDAAGHRISLTHGTAVVLEAASSAWWLHELAPDALLTGRVMLSTRGDASDVPSPSVAATLTWREKKGARAHTLTASQRVAVCAPVTVPALLLRAEMSSDNETIRDDDDDASLPPALRLPAFPADLVQVRRGQSVGEPESCNLPPPLLIPQRRATDVESALGGAAVFVCRYCGRVCRAVHGTVHCSACASGGPDRHHHISCDTRGDGAACWHRRGAPPRPLGSTFARARN
jgi:hypothetical protein